MFLSRPSFTSRAFTLIELLVVIAIIGILMGILLPSLARARRQGLVVASPIAYMGDDGRVRLTTGSGSGEVDLRVTSRISCPVCHTPPTWSPSGMFLAMRGFAKVADPSQPSGTRDQGYTTIVDPMADNVKNFPEKGTRWCFTTWLDNDRIVISDRGAYYVTNRQTGAPLGWLDISHSNVKQFLFATPTPSGSTAAFVGVIKDPYTGDQTVTFFGKNMRPTRAIATLKGIRDPGNVAFPRIDPFGDYVAWSQYKAQFNGTKTWQIGLKDTHSPSTNRPFIIGGKYLSAAFCDFTESGDLLANVTKDMKSWKLVIFARDGKLIREIDTPTPPGPGTVAAWRKFGRK